MCNLISSELFKIRKSKVTYVIGIVFTAMALLQIVAYACLRASGKMTGEVTGLLGLVTPLDGDISYFIISIFITLIVCQDFSTGSIRQIIGKGSSKVKYVFAKYITVVLVVALYMIGYSLIDFIAFSIMGEVGEVNLEVVKNLLIFVVGAFSMILGYVAVTEFICILCKRYAIAIPVNLAFMLGGTMGMELIYFLTEKEAVYKYWLSNMSASFGDFDIANGEKLTYIAVFLVWAVVFSVMSVVVFNKRDID